MRCRCAGGDHAAPAACTSSASKTGGVLARWFRRASLLVQWAAPIATLILIPKCPACVAGYVLLLSGVGLSFSAAETVRWAVIGLCAAILVFVSVRSALGLAARLSWAARR